MKLTELSLKEFLVTLSGDSPAPGGGSVSALAGALSAALCSMVARLTLGKEKHRGAWKEMERLREAADVLSSRLLELVEEDSAAYNRVVAAFRIPKENKSAREKAIQSATREAASVPMETLRTSTELVDLVKTALDQGNPNCLTDAGVSLQLLRAAANGAAYNVRINLPGIKDRDLRSRLASETSKLLALIEGSLKEMEKAVMDRLE
jgi:glutamate formiminotransferase/formiminotetrahydrofolate cyclodeaminase